MTPFTPRKKPLRKCVACREMKEKSEILRIVSTENGVQLDPTGKANGRGAYVCKNHDCLQLVQKNKGLERSLKRAIPHEIYELLKTER